MTTATMTENHNINSINWVAGMSDPGEMIACGAYQQLRRQAGEADGVYQARITVLLADLPAKDRAKILKAGREAAIKRADLDVSTGKVAVMTAGERAWHGLGVNVSECQTGEESEKLASMGFKILKEEVFLKSGAKVDGLYALVRNDTGYVTGDAGRQYKVFQNSECFKLMHAICNTNDAIFETCGSLKNGKVIWMMARLPKTVKLAVNPEDETVTYILLTNEHTGKGALRIVPVTVRVVCANTLALALGKATKGGGFTLRHCNTMEGKVADARKKIGIILERVDEFEAEINALASKSMMETEVTSYLEELFPVKRTKPGEKQGVGQDIVAEFLATKDSVGHDVVAEHLDKEAAKNAETIKEILELYHNAPTNNLEGVSGTAWALWNAVSEWCDHKRPVRGKDDAKRTEARVSNNFFGPSNAIKQDAYQSMLKRFKN